MTLTREYSAWSPDEAEEIIAPIARTPGPILRCLQAIQERFGTYRPTLSRSSPSAATPLVPTSTECSRTTPTYAPNPRLRYRFGYVPLRLARPSAGANCSASGSKRAKPTSGSPS